MEVGGSRRRKVSKKLEELSIHMHFSHNKEHEEYTKSKRVTELNENWLEKAVIASL